jgi:hypothetical protein
MLTELPPASVANERNAFLRWARDAPARKFARAGTSREMFLAAMDFFD